MRLPTLATRSGFVLSSLALVSGLTFAAPANRAKAVELVRQAAAAFQQANLTRTINLCRQATIADPSYPRSYTWMGAAYQRQGNRAAACNAFRRVIKLEPKGDDANRARRGIRELGCDSTTAVAIKAEARWSETVGNNGIVFSNDGNQLMGAGRDGSWRVWGVPNGTLHQLRRGDSFELTGVDAAGDRSAASSGSGTVRIYNWRDGRELSKVEGRLAANSVSFSTDGRFFATGVSEGVRLFDAQSGAQRDVFRTDNPVTAVKFSPSGSMLAAGAGNEVHIYDANSGRLIRRVTVGTLAVQAVAWSSSGTTVAAATGYNIRTFNVSTGKMGQELRGHRLTVTTLAFGNGALLASGGYDGQLRFWDVTTGAPRGAYSAHAAPIGSLAFAPGNKRLASADHNGGICLWKLP